MDLCIQRHNHHSHAVTSVLFAGNLIVAGSLDGAVSFINILFSEVIQRINVPTKCRGVTCVSELGAESASGTFVVGTESGRLVKVSMSDTSVRCKPPLLLPLPHLKIPLSFDALYRPWTAGLTRAASCVSTRQHWPNTGSSLLVPTAAFEYAKPQRSTRRLFVCVCTMAA